MGKSEHPEAREFYVDTRFQRMARRQNGVPRDKAIKQANVQLEQVKPQFDAWLEGVLQEFAALIRNAEAGAAPAGWPRGANQLCHQMRDGAATLGFELLAFIANSLCDILDAIEAGSACNMESITCHLDALMLARKAVYRHMKPEQVPELTKGLHKVVKRVAV
jgi:hypothetical protein